MSGTEFFRSSLPVQLLASGLCCWASQPELLRGEALRTPSLQRVAKVYSGSLR